VKGQEICVVQESSLPLVTKLCMNCMDCDVHGHVLRTYNLPVLHFNSFFIRDVHGEFGLINVHLFDILPALSSGQ